MKEHYVSYEQAVALKRLGFAERTTYEYTEIVEGSGREEWDEDEQRMMFIEDINYYPKLRLDQAAAWMRENYNWHIIIEPKIWDGLHYDFKLWHKFRGYENANRGFDFSTYESALSAGIDKVLELLGKDVDNA